MFWILCAAASAAGGGVTVVDEVVAVVHTTPILSSDLALAELVRLVPAVEDEAPEDRASRLLDARIRLELQLLDLAATGALYRLEPDVDRVLAAFESRAGGAEALDRGLRAGGLERADVEALALRVAAAEAYVEQRLRPRLTVGLDELERAYRELVVEPVTAQGETPPPLVEVREQLLRVVVERQLNAQLALWLEQAAARSEVTRFSR